MTISTAALYNSILFNIQNDQTQQATLANQVASQKVSQSLAGYGDQTASLTALNSTAAQLNSYVDGAQSVADKLATQDTALSTVSTAAQAARTAIAQAVGQNDATTLIQTLQAQLTTAASALNTQYQGQYLFSGGQVNTPPVATTSLSSLNTPADVTAAFKNGQVVSASRLDANTVVPTGVLASDVGTPLFNALQAVQAYNAGPNGPLTGALTSDQQTFLSGVLSQFDGALASTTDQVAANGVVQAQVATAQTSLGDQQTAIQGVIGNITDADPAKLSNQLNLASTALQASAEVFQSLQSDSLLTLLSGQG